MLSPVPDPDNDSAALQRALRASRDYVGPITGILDASTIRAVRFFQARNGLDVNGVADALTRSLLGCPARKVSTRLPLEARASETRTSETRPVVRGRSTGLVTVPPDVRTNTTAPRRLTG